MSTSWETELAALLNELSSVQSELLALITRKRALIIAGEMAVLPTLQADEQRLIARLEGCQSQRAAMLAKAAGEGLPSTSLRALADALPRGPRGALQKTVQEAASRSRMLQHQSLTNWVLVQRSLIHLSQMLEIIATGGRREPTYGNGSPSTARGAVLDRAA